MARKWYRQFKVIAVCLTWAVGCTLPSPVELPVKDPPILRLQGREYHAGLPALVVDLTDSDVVGPVGSFTASGTPLQGLMSDVAYEVKGLDPRSYVAIRTEAGSTTEVRGGETGSSRNTFQTTGWMLAYVPGSLPNSAICRYVREGWRRPLRC